MKLVSLKIDPWMTDPTKFYREAKVFDEKSGITFSFDLSDEDVADINYALRAGITKRLSVFGVQDAQRQDS